MVDTRRPLRRTRSAYLTHQFLQYEPRTKAARYGRSAGGWSATFTADGGGRAGGWLGMVLDAYYRDRERAARMAELWERSGWLPRTFARTICDYRLADHGHAPPSPDYSGSATRGVKVRQSSSAPRRWRDADPSPDDLVGLWNRAGDPLGRALVTATAARIVAHLRCSPPMPASARNFDPHRGRPNRSIDAAPEVRRRLADAAGMAEADLLAKPRKPGAAWREAVRMVLADECSQATVAVALDVTEAAVCRQVGKSRERP